MSAGYGYEPEGREFESLRARSGPETSVLETGKSRKKLFPRAGKAENTKLFLLYKANICTGYLRGIERNLMSRIQAQPVLNFQEGASALE